MSSRPSRFALSALFGTFPATVRAHGPGTMFAGLLWFPFALLLVAFLVLAPTRPLIKLAFALGVPALWLGGFLGAIYVSTALRLEPLDAEWAVLLGSVLLPALAWGYGWVLVRGRQKARR